MADTPKIMVIGSYNMDLVVRTPRMPVKGETILGGPFFSGPGGKGANQAVGAARLGGDVTMLVRLGQDGFGDTAAANLAREGIRPDLVLRSVDARTGVALILVDDGGENMIVVASGANARLIPKDVDGARDAITQASVVLLQLESPLETIRHAVALAHAAHVPVLLNPAPGQALDTALLRQVDVLTPNQTELAILSGTAVESLNEAAASEAMEASAIAQAARRLLAQGVGAVVVTLGAEGALIVDGGGARHVPGYRVEAVDTTGAGDAFNAALAVALGEKQSMAEAVRFANAAAALQVTKEGAAPAMPYREDVTRFLSEQ